MHASIRIGPSSMHILKRQHNKGFTLVEIAIALLVVALLAAGAISALRVQIAYTRTSQAREQLREAREALINYAIANQKLPCAAQTTNGTAGLICNSTKGFLPWQDLGLTAADPWGQTLHYLVTTGFTTTGFGYGMLGELKVWSGTNNIDPNKAVAFAVWSTGADGTDASSTTPVGTPVIDNYSVVAEGPASDDLVEWVSRYVIFGKMSVAGRTLSLPAASSSSSASSSGP
ncbi:MAG: hypothetical protein JWN23_2079 [Rhodocyclales bacterium]|nr:hypothetical protein [Rhodocyclales bacterium]